MISNQSDKAFLYLALYFVEGLGSIKSNLLLQHFGTIESIFEASKNDLKHIVNGINEKIIQQIIQKQSFDKAEAESKFCLQHQIDIIYPESIEYPARLKHIPDKPFILFKRGNIIPQIKHSISIVGTRKSTDYGHRFLDSFFENLKLVKDIQVISGLALGIDQRAHMLSVKHQIPTLAVMGLGLDKIYPAQNKRLADMILKEGGGWLSETSSQDKTTQGLFPRRNRLIAGLSDALFVVETDIEGGAVITSKLANDYGKEVFALAGRYSDANSRGCNELIKSNIAALVNQPLDIIESMSWNHGGNKSIPKSIEIDFEGTVMQKSVLDLIRKSPKIDFETLLSSIHTNHGELVEVLLELELDGLIQTLPGNKYELI